MLSVTLTRHPVSALTLAPAVPALKRSAKTMIATAQEFLALMRSTDPVDYERFRHDSAPIEVWRELISRYSLANEWIVRNKTAPVEILREIACDSRVLVRAEVAMTRRITEDIQETLARDPNASVRNTLANNSKATDRILALLAEDSEAFVRETARRRINERRAEQSADCNPH